MRLFLIFIFCTSCSNLSKNPDGKNHLDYYQNRIHDSDIWVKIHDNFSDIGNTFSLNQHYEFLIISQSQESRDFWPHPMWQIKFDNDMPFICMGRFKRPYAKSKLIENIENFINDEPEVVAEPVSCAENLHCEEIAFVSHTISYNIEAKYDGRYNEENSLYLSIYTREGENLNGSTISYELLKTTKAIFDDAGLNVFKWRPKKYLFDQFICSN